MMHYRFEFRPYQRRFRQPLQTSHGRWEIREGIIIRLTDETGRLGWGEIAPLPWFGSETLEESLDFCHQLGDEITTKTIFSIPTKLRACQFGFESAWEDFEPPEEARKRGRHRDKSCGGNVTRADLSAVNHAIIGSNRSPVSTLPPGWGKVTPRKLSIPCGLSPGTKTRDSQSSDSRISEGYGRTSSRIPVSLERGVSKIHTTDHRCPGQNKLSYSSLLPACESALQVWETLWNQGYRTFKWKIGVAPIEDELKVFNQLIQALPTGGKLRLDANGGLTWEEAKEWLRVCDRARVEFLEQPLPVDHFHALLELSTQHSTPIALDESVATLDQMEALYVQGWRGIFVIKPCVAGSPKLLRQFCQTHKIDTVFSSVFETAIGRKAALKLAAELSQHNRAVGFGVNHWFTEDNKNWLDSLWKNH